MRAHAIIANETLPKLEAARPGQAVPIQRRSPILDRRLVPPSAEVLQPEDLGELILFVAPRPALPERGDDQPDDEPDVWDVNWGTVQPFAEVFPEAYRDWKHKGGRPKAIEPKVRIGLHLAADVVSALKASGKNYNARVKAILRAAIHDGRL